MGGVRKIKKIKNKNVVLKRKEKKNKIKSGWVEKRIENTK